MGKLVDGVWHDVWYDTGKTGGHFKRQDSSFRDWVRKDGSTAYAPASGRYRLYVSHACPWAHRTLILRTLKGLEDAIDVVVVDYLMLEKGWILPDGNPLHTVYTKADPAYTGRVTVPVLWDLDANAIVSNESSEIIRMLNTEFDDIATRDCADLYPQELRAEIDEINDFVYHKVNNGVYKAGFATTQDAYEQNVSALFDALEVLDKRLGEKRYLVGDRITEADWRLFTTLVRFDPVYVGHFKCNLKRIVDFPNLWGYVRELYQWDGIAGTVNMEHIKGHYYASHGTINPTGVVPMGPEIDFMAPHGRG